ncbi:hypothetical protein SPD48_04685 [Pseudogracilibacillus sp. SE30717A]|uniref:hypothetical protein n=1 Tax=Pseudogracilibacillus sp. SE30717A TaxID=3098293 RepID=UPI00300DEB77
MYGLSEEVTDIIREGFELENIHNLMPGKLLPNIVGLKEQMPSNFSIIKSPELLTKKIIK